MDLASSVADTFVIESVPGTDPRLPPEIECAIFEISAISRPATIPNLMLVARRVKIRVEPILYRIVLRSKSGMPPLEGCPRISFETLLQAIDEKPHEFFNNAARHLFLDDPAEGWPSPELRVKTIESIVNACTGITSILSWTRLTENLPALASLESLGYLAVNIADLFGRNPTGCFTHPLFRNITHLEILYFPPESHFPDAAASLSLIPHLTHFGFDEPELCGVFCGVLRACAHLTCIVLLTVETMEESDMNEAKPLAEDARFVAIYQKNWEADWVRGASGQADFWVLADTFLVARRAGKVDRSRYYIHDDDNSWFDVAA
ncbi:hypothetical protein B0H11DRAFT_2284819 [Mycena galericulata]|nr:hypothetical protein B0H11DRAFT_2284819 [Mycena galericulata]